MLRHAPESQAAPLVLNVAQPRHQSRLGDDEATETRLASLRDETARKLEVYGAVGPQKPKNMLDFCRNVAYKKTGGQQLEADCMFCGFHLVSTGASRVV